MLAKTHAAFGLLAALVTLKYAVIAKPVLFVILVVLGVFLPDLDHPESKINRTLKITKIIPFLFKHRGVFHSIFGAIIICGAIGYWVGLQYGLGLFVGYLSHLISDALTVSGVNFLQPISHFKIQGPVRTGSFFETLVFIAVLGVSAWLLVH